MKLGHALVIGFCIILAGAIIAFAVRGPWPGRLPPGPAAAKTPAELDAERLLGKWKDTKTLLSVTYEFLPDGNVHYRNVAFNQVIAWKVIEPGRMSWDQPNLLSKYGGGDSTKTYANYTFVGGDELKIDIAVGNTSVPLYLKRVN